MSRFQKRFSLAVILALLLSSLIMVESACALASKPSIPEFTVTYVPASYTKTTTNPYTGEVTNEQINNSTIEVKIKNQIFDYSVGDVKYYLFYQIASKGHFEDEWSGHYSYESNLTFSQGASKYALKQNENSQFTTAIFLANYYPAQSQVDFRVQTVVMHDGLVKVYNSDIWIDLSYHLEPGYVYGETGDWSNTQTITIPAGASTETSNPTFQSPTPTNSQNPTVSPRQTNLQNTALFGVSWEQVAIIVLAVVVAVLLVALAVLARKVNVMQTRISQN
jgi:hypothetical protein